MTTTDPRLEAFLSPNAPDVFRSVLGSDDVWRPDRLDVEEIHRDARAAFDLLLSRNAGGTGENRSKPDERMFLIKGDSGSGKTHLMRAFRAAAHRRGSFFAYLQLTTGIADYDRYLLLSVLDAMQKPHNVEDSDESSLSFLSRSLLQEASLFGLFGVDELGQLTSAFDASLGLDRLDRFGAVPSDMLQVLLALQLRDPAVTKRVHKYLRCEELTPTDTALLGGVLARRGDNAARETLRALASLVRELYHMPLVICVDQLEDVFTPGEDEGVRFRTALASLRGQTEDGDVVVVVSSLTDFYLRTKPLLDQSLIDRLEHGIEPITLASGADAAQVRALLEYRLRYLYETMESRWNANEPLYPFDPGIGELLANQRFRTVIRVAGKAREQSLASGEPPRVEDILTPSPVAGHPLSAEATTISAFAGIEAPIPAEVSDLGQRWNDLTLTFDPELPDDAAHIGSVLVRALEAVGPEIAPSRYAALAPFADGWRLDLTTNGARESAYLEVANQSAAFGHLGNAVERIGFRSASHKLSPIVVRNDEFPKNPKTKIAKIIGSLIAQGGRTVVIRDQELGVLLAFFEFAERYGSDPHFGEWRRDTRPLASLPGIQALLRIDGLPEPAIHANGKAGPVEVHPPAPVSVDVKPRVELHIAAPALSDPIELGTKSDGSSLSVLAHDLTRHAAILGGAGSGKTTLAFRLIEQLLARGIQAVLIDRKGDLAAYAEPLSWEREVDEATRTRRTWLRSRTDIRLFTPGSQDGRDLAIPTLPAGLDGLGAGDAEQEARDAADGLAAMLEWGAARRDRLAVLKQAITTLGTLRPGERSTLATLVDFISSYPPELLAAIGKLDRKLLDKVVQDIETLRINEGRLLDGGAEQLDVENILGPSDTPGDKTKLTIISTKFLGSLPTQLFWIARFLSEVGRYASRNPKPTLQGVVFLDEADIYLPATSKPATKQPLENLIRRARSAGIGVFLATQSPGDLDYKSRENITTWLAGRVSQERAIEKLRPVFGNSGRYADELPALTVGNFFAVDEHGVRRFTATLPCIMPVQLEESRLLELARL